MSDPVSLATLDVLTKVVPAALLADDNLYSLAICRMVNLSLEHGNTDASCVAYVCAGRLHCGTAFRRLRCRLSVRPARLSTWSNNAGGSASKLRTYMLFGNLVMPWTKHVRTGRDLVRRAFERRMQIGDLTFATYSCNSLISEPSRGG